jgi:hypothetical protein
LQNFVQLCNKNGLNQFKKYVDKHIVKNEEPQERPDTRMVQSCLNSDGTRTLVKYDKKRILNEFARYIAKKEQPISMAYCIDFARLVIRGRGQPLYKRFHHNKMVSDLKKHFVERKNELLVIFAVATYKISITSDIWTAGK